MPEIKYTYKKNDLEFLFKKEEELLKRITPFCDTTNKNVAVEYEISIGEPLQFILTVIIIQDEK